MHTEAQMFAALTPHERARLKQSDPSRYKKARAEWTAERESVRAKLSSAESLAERRKVQARLVDLESTKSPAKTAAGVAPDTSYSAEVYAKLKPMERSQLKAQDRVKHDILRDEWSSECKRLQALVSNGRNFKTHADYKAAASTLARLKLASCDRAH